MDMCHELPKENLARVVAHLDPREVLKVGSAARHFKLLNIVGAALWQAGIEELLLVYSEYNAEHKQLFVISAWRDLVALNRVEIID